MVFINKRVGLDYGEELHWSRSLGEWSNMIGYEMGSSERGGVTGGEFQAWRTWLANMAVFFAREILWRAGLLGNLNPPRQE